MVLAFGAVRTRRATRVVLVLTGGFTNKSISLVGSTSFYRGPTDKSINIAHFCVVFEWSGQPSGCNVALQFGPDRCSL